MPGIAGILKSAKKPGIVRYLPPNSLDTSVVELNRFDIIPKANAKVVPVGDAVTIRPSIAGFTRTPAGNGPSDFFPTGAVTFDPSEPPTPECGGDVVRAMPSAPTT